MPELPEVETVVRGLRECIVGETIKDVILNAPPATIEVSKKFKPAKLDKALVGKKILEVNRRGKNILIQLSDKCTLWVHLKMTGHMFYKSRLEPIEKHDLAIFNFKSTYKKKSGFHLRFNDYRRFGRLRLFYDDEIWEHKGLRSLGPEPLEISKYDFVSLLNSSKRMIKPALMDQSFIVGIGNIYADESLHLAKINPKRLTSSVSKKKLEQLHSHIQKILKYSISKMGTSVDSYSGVNGQTGNYQNYLKAYGNEGNPCGFCGNKIIREKIGSRSAHYCPKCQRL